MQPETLHPLARHVEAFDCPAGVIGEQSHFVPTAQQRARQVEGMEAPMDHQRDLHLTPLLVSTTLCTLVRRFRLPEYQLPKRSRALALLARSTSTCGCTRPI